MRKAALCVSLFLAVASGGGLFAEPMGVGLEFGNPSGVLVIRPAPFDIKIGYDFTGMGSQADGDFLHLSCDYRLIDRYALIDFLSLYLSAGGYLQILTGDTQDNIVLGGRLPVGLQAFLLDGTVEVFVELVPTVKFLPTIVAFDDWQGFVGFTVSLAGLKLKK